MFPFQRVKTDKLNKGGTKRTPKKVKRKLKQATEDGKEFEQCRRSIQHWIQSLPDQQDPPTEHPLSVLDKDFESDTSLSSPLSFDLNEAIIQPTANYIRSEITTDNLLPTRLRDRKTSGVSSTCDCLFVIEFIPSDGTCMHPPHLGLSILINIRSGNKSKFFSINTF